MLHKVVPIFLVLCVGGLNSLSDQAVSMQSFHRNDAPLSYKFTQVHPPHDSIRVLQQHSAPVEKKLRPVQYAPIPFKAEHFKKQPDNRLYMSTSDPSNYEEPSEVERDGETVEKVNIEPFVDGSRNENLRKYNALYRYDAYAPGQNIELHHHHPSISHPVQPPPHAVLITNQITDKISLTTESSTYLQNVSENKNMTASSISPKHFSQVNEFYRDLLHRQRPGSSHQAVIYHDDHIPQIVERHQRQPQHAAYALIPRRYVNVARTYGIAYNTNKAPTNAFSNKFLTLEQNAKLKTAAMSKKKHF